MSDSSQTGSIRQLPPGKLSGIKKLFEDGDNTFTKGDKPHPPARPPPPPPPGKVMSPVHQQSVLKQPSAKLPAAQQPQPATLTVQASYLRNQDGVGGQQVSDINRINSDSLKHTQQVGGAKKLSPSVTGRFMTSPDSVVPSQSDDKSLEKISREKARPATDISEFYAKVNKPKKDADKRVMFNTEDKAESGITRREAIRKNMEDKRKTVAVLEMGSAKTESNTVNVAQRTKLFDGPKGEKPGLPQKPESVKRKFSMRTPKELEQLQQHNIRTANENDGCLEPENFYNPPWDRNSVLEKLKRNLPLQSPPTIKKDSSGNGSTSVAPPKPPVLAGLLKKSDLTSQKVDGKDDENFLQTKPVEATAESSPQHKKAPPPKPPRTHAHDDYLRVKVSASQNFETKPSTDISGQVASTSISGQVASTNISSQVASTNISSQVASTYISSQVASTNISSQVASTNISSQVAGRKTVDGVKDETRQNGTEFLSVKDRVLKMQQQSDPAAAAMPLPLPSCSFSVRNTEQVSSVRQPAPSRPPPPKRRPNSSDHPADFSGSYNSYEDYPKDDDGGPIIIPLSPRSHQTLKKQSSDVHDLHSRHPNDALPPEPCSLKKFPLRKSRSSECLHSSRSSSLNGELDEDDHVNTMSRSSFGSQYEAVIDSDGYAIPNVFLPVARKNRQSVRDENFARSPNKYLTKVKGFGGEVVTAKNESGQVVKATSAQEQSLDKVNKKKMIMVKQKINQAYADVDFVGGGKSETIENDFQIVDLEPEGESVTEPAVLKKRIDYCTSVRLNASKSVKRGKEYLSAIYPQLFEYCLIVGLRQLVDSEGYEPYVMHKFPENVSSNLSVPKFCFPDASIFKPGSATLSESYSFVMTNADGSRVFGYCRRLQPSDSSLPEVICIISPIDAFNMYSTLLGQIETKRRISLDQASELIAASFGRPLPKPGKVCHIRTLDEKGEMETIFLNRSADNRLENVNYESPLHYLGTDRLVKVFSSILMERRVILCSSNLSILTQTVYALSALLYPFQWQHVYIPLLPCEMLEVVNAPVPYIVGVLSAFLPRLLKMDLEEVFIVELDKKNIVKCQSDESTILPKRVQKALKTAINMCKIDAEARNAQWLMVAEAFLRVFIETVGHFNNHISTLQDGNRVFKKEAFISEVISKEVKEFLAWFTETQMFEVFITNHVERSDYGTSDLFLQRLNEYRESKEESGWHKGLGAKVKSFGKALKTKLQAS